MLEKAYNSKEVSKWETMNKDILVAIFNKLNVMDLTMGGASRVCISWFLASHDKTLWQTVNLAKLQVVVFSYSPWWKTVVLYNHRVEDEVEEVRLSFRNVLVKKMINFFSCMQGEVEKGTSLRKLLIEITNLSGTLPKNLIFNSYSYIKEKDLMFAAKRMPNIEKLVLSHGCYQTEKSFRFAFSQWKNLKTLIIAYDDNWEFEFETVGENCTNLTNLKYFGYLDEYYAEQIVRCFKKLKRLSLRCSFVADAGALSLINGLQNHVILNLAHCLFPHLNLLLGDMVIMNRVPNDTLVQAATQKLDKFIKCSEDCSFCKGWTDRFTLLSKGMFKWHPYTNGWQNDEIEEFVF